MPAARRLLVLLVALAAAALVAAGCGSPSSAGDRDPASAVPASTLFYGAVQVRPEGDVKSGAEAAGRKILDGKPLGPELQRLFDQAADTPKVNYEDDIEPWLGRRIALAVTGLRGSSADVLAVVDSSDDGKARDALEKDSGSSTERSYRGVDYRVDGDTSAAVTGGFVLLGSSERALRSGIDTLKGDRALGDVQRYRQSTAKVAANGLGLFYVDFRRLVELIALSSPQNAQALAQVRALPQFASLQATALSLTADGEAIRLDAPAMADSGDGAAAVARLPAGSWLALASPDAGRSLRTQLTNGTQGAQFSQLRSLFLRQTGIDVDRDLLSWVRGVSVFASGTNLLDLRAGLVLESADPAASRRALEKLRGLVERSRGARVRRTRDGFTLRDPQAPAPFTFAAERRRVIVGYGNDLRAAFAPRAPTLAGSPAYAAAQRALGGAKPAFLVSVPQILALADGLGAGNDPQYARARRVLDAFGALTSGVVEQDGERLTRLAVGLR